MVDALIFTNREIAAAIWLIGFLVVAALRIPGVGRSFGGVVRAFLTWKIVGIFAAGAIWAGVSVAILAWAGIWTVGELGTTIVWGLTFAGITLLDVNRATEDDAFYRKIARDTIAGTALVLFVAEFKSFPLWFELILVPIAAVLGGMKALAERDPQHADAERLIDVLLFGLSLLTLGYAVAHAVAAPGAFLSGANLRRFLVPVALSVMFLPFLAAVATMMVYETTGSAMSLRHWHLRDPRLRRYSLWRAFLAFGWNYDLLRRWKRSVMTLDPADQAAVDASIERLQNRVRRERHPPPVPASEGWCPERARLFLDDHGLRCGYYDDLHGEWQASSPYREFEGGVISDNLAYYVIGDGMAARRLTLTLNRNDLDMETGSEAAFTEAAERLALRARRCTRRYHTGESPASGGRLGASDARRMGARMLSTTNARETAGRPPTHLTGVAGYTSSTVSQMPVFVIAELPPNVFAPQIGRVPVTSDRRRTHLVICTRSERLLPAPCSRSP